MISLQFAVVSQSCLPDGNVFTTQTQIDSFTINYPGCTSIGKQQVIRNDEGLPSGVYYYRTHAGEKFTSGKIILSK